MNKISLGFLIIFKNIKRSSDQMYRVGHYIMIEDSLHQEDTTILNLYALKKKKKASKIHKAHPLAHPLS